MWQKPPINNFGWIQDNSQFNEDFIKHYNEKIDEGYFLEVNVQYMEKLSDNHNNLPLLPGIIKIEKIGKLVANLHAKTEFLIPIKILKQALTHELVLEKAHKVIEINQNAWLKPYFYMNKDLQKSKKWFWT